MSEPDTEEITNSGFLWGMGLVVGDNGEIFTFYFMLLYTTEILLEFFYK